MESKKDKLESFIQSNREEFDEIEITSSIWENINSSIKKEVKPQVKMVPLKMVLQLAASVIIVLGGGLFYYMNQLQKKDGIEIAQVKEDVEFKLSYVSEEMKEVEDYYTTQVDMKLKRAKKLNVDPELMEEIELLDEEFKKLQQEANNSIDNKKIIEAMIDNYRLKLTILEDILSEFDDTKKDKEQTESVNL